LTRAVVPLNQMSRRLPEAGRLRTGVKTRSAMKAIDSWRATSHDETAIRQLAEIYGGTPRPWTDGPTRGQWEVITEATELNVVLPPDPMGGTPLYELWSGGGCQRRCDGYDCEIPTAGPDGPEMMKVPCVCAAEGALACNPHTRLSVILPDVRFGGTWRYESKSWNIAQEMPGMVDLIRSFQERGLTRAVLALEHRKSVQNKKPFTIPVLRVPESLDAIAAGSGRVVAIDAPETPVEIGPGRPVDDAVDAELIDPDEIPDRMTVREVLAVRGVTGEAVADQADLDEMGAPHAVRHQVAAGHADRAATAVSEEQVAAWVALGRKLPLVLGADGAAAFKQWRESRRLPRRPTTVGELDLLVGEVRLRYQDAHGGPRKWADSDLAEAHRLIAGLRGTREWPDFAGVAFENFADQDRPETWTDDQFTILSTWIRMDRSTPPSNPEGTAHGLNDDNRTPVTA
jgi:hypothetical protein